MNQELRHGKYTEDELIDIMLSRISEFERGIVNETLIFLDLKLNDFVFNKEEGLIKDDYSPDITRALDSSLMKGITEKLSKATEEKQILNFQLFMKIIPNIMYQYSQFCIEINDVNDSIEGQELTIKNNVKVKSRLNALYPKEHDDVIENMKHTVIELKKARATKNNSKEKKIVWNREVAQLNKLSKILHKNDFTNHEKDFENAINKEEICRIKKEMVDTFVILIYRLVQSEIPYIKSNMKTARGVISIAKKLFPTNEDGYQKIHFAVLNTRMKNDPNLKKANELVDRIISNLN